MKYEPRRNELCHARRVCYGLNLAGGSQTRSPAKTQYLPAFSTCSTDGPRQIIARVQVACACPATRWWWVVSLQG